MSRLGRIAWRGAVSVAVTAVLVALAGCTAASPSGPHPTDSPADHARWGVPAKAAPPGITYQPDVKVVGGGRNAVWGASSDALQWTLDANAPGMSDVHPGDVLFASSLVAGRVVRITRQGDRDQVVLLPISLTDLIKDGKVDVDRTLGTSGAVWQQVDSPVLTQIPQGTDVTGAAQTVADVAAAPAVSKEPMKAPIPASGGPSISVNGFEVGVGFAPDGLNVSLTKNLVPDKNKKIASGGEAGLKIGFDLGLHFDSWRVKNSTSITGGKITSSSTVMQGLNAITLGLTGGAASPASDNTRFRIEVPYTLEEPTVGPGGIPMVIQLKITLLIATAFGGNNATLSASAEYKVGKAANFLTGLSLTVNKSLVASIAGLSLAPSGYVFGVGVRVLVGVGLPGLAVGPYAKLTVTVGISNGSALGAPLVRCHGATLDVSGAIGAAGYLSSDSLVGAFKAVGVPASAFSIFEKKLKIESENAYDLSKQLIHRTAFLPDKAICKL